MNTATEAKLDSDSEPTSIDRRRGMTLVSPTQRSDRKRSLSIKICDKIFSSSRTSQATQAECGKTTAKPTSEVGLGNDPDTTSRDISTRKLVTITGGITVAGAIVLGYLIGRSRD